MTEEEIDRLNILEKRVKELENLINLILTLKNYKVDLSNFTCDKIQLEGIQTK
jgi:hypothetical protein|tara:strand:+ start:2600 stop:2758 length:159 start_codon:yes stop_codon:yes gene_type:complete